MFSTIFWAVVLGAISIVGLWAAGSGKSWGWAVCMGGQIVWTAYVFIMWRLEMVPNVVIFAVLYTRNYLVSRERDHQYKLLHSQFGIDQTDSKET